MPYWDLLLLTEVLSQGVWYLEALPTGKVNLLVRKPSGQIEPVAQALAREVAEFLMVARTVLPAALKDLEEERAYHSQLQDDYTVLCTEVQALRNDLVSHEIEGAQDLKLERASAPAPGVALTSVRRPVPALHA